MGRIRTEVNRDELQNAINQVETANGGAFANRSLLHAAVANTEWAKNNKPKPVTESVVLLRIAEFNIQPLTPVGQRGRKPGFKMDPARSSTGSPMKPRKRKSVTTNERSAKIFSNLEENLPPRFHKLIKRAQAGSKSAAIKLNCVVCVGGESVAQNVRGCTATACSLYPFRPYQTLTIGGIALKDGEDIPDGVDIEEIDSSEVDTVDADEVEEIESSEDEE